MYVQDSIKHFFNPSHEIMEKWRKWRSVTSTKVLVFETQKPNMNHKSQAIK